MKIKTIKTNIQQGSKIRAYDSQVIDVDDPNEEEKLDNVGKR